MFKYIVVGSIDPDDSKIPPFPYEDTSYFGFESSNEVLNQFKIIENKLSAIEKKHLSYGTALSHGGIDGSPQMSRILPVLLYVRKFLDKNLPKNYFIGIDYGSGSGITSFLMNYILGIKMVGFEWNISRYLYSLRMLNLVFEESLNLKVSDTVLAADLQSIALSSLIFWNSGSLETNSKSSQNMRSSIETTRAEHLLGNFDEHMVFVYWFCLGWSLFDINEVVENLLNFPNLKYILTDQNLQTLGYRGKFH